MITNLVLGSEGFVGKPLCKFLADLGEVVIPYDIVLDSQQDCRIAQLKLDNVDRVYFLAWDVGGAKYLYQDKTQLSQLDWNLKLLLNIMPQLESKHLPFLFVSSQLAEEYDTVYGVTKRLGEVWTKLLKGLRLRLWNVYGSVELPSERSHVVADLAYQALSTGKIRLLTTGEEQRQFIHIEDVCRAFHTAFTQHLEGVYDVTSFEWIKIIDIAHIIAAFTGAEIIPGERIGSTPITPIRGKIPGWLPQVTMQEGIRTIVDDMQALTAGDKKV